MISKVFTGESFGAKLYSGTVNMAFIVNMASGSSGTLLQSSLDFKLGNIVGRGGYGIVYTLLNRSDIVVKVSSQTNSCRQWSNEYEKIVAAFTSMKAHPLYQSLTTVKMIDVKMFTQEDRTCFMVMERVFRPVYGDCNPKTFNKDSPTLQAQFGVEDSDLIHKGRGQFIGLRQIKGYLESCPMYQNATVETICHELGIFIGLLHFIAKNDGYDIEVFLGREYVEPRLKVFIADFDLSEPITQYDKATISRMTFCLDAVPYFPSKDNPDLFDRFANAYRSVAKSAGFLQVADIVLENYD